MIKAIDLTRFRNAEYLQFMKNFATLVETNDPVALNVVAQYNALIAKNAELEALFKKEQASEITQELINLDNRRDRAFNGILSVVDGFTYHFDEAKAQAATRLKTNLNLYGVGVARQNYQAETAILTNIANDWENKPELKDTMILLNLEEWKDEMKTANELFDKKYLERTLEYSEASPENLLLKRAETTKVYYNLRQFIDAFAVTINTPIYEKVTNQLNALIDQYNTLLNNRQSSGETPVTPDTP